jgi:hypothetical protein
MMHGAFAPAREMLAAAGEWETAVALAVCQGDLASLRELAFPGTSAPPAPAAAPPPAAAPAAAQPTGVGLGLLDDDFGLGELSAGYTGAYAGLTGAGGAGAGGGAGGGAPGWARAQSGLSEAEKGELSRLARALVAAHERNAGRMFGAVNACADWKVRRLTRGGSGRCLSCCCGRVWERALAPEPEPETVLRAPLPPPAAAPRHGGRQLLQQRVRLELRRPG